MKGGGTKPEILEDPRGYIPELEAEAQRQAAFVWSEEEDAILKRYYLKVAASRIVPFIPGKTVDMIHRRAEKLSLTRSRGGKQ
jgi:hypothetical protein